MEILIVNLTGEAVPEVINGRDHLVAPMTIMVSGVLPGSKGKLFYPAEEVLRSPSSWDNSPITLNHPKLGGKFVLARENPLLVSKWGMGFLRNTLGLSAPARLLTQGCFDVARTARIARDVLTALREGTPLELSTGLEASYSPVLPGAAFNGREFSHIARDYKPDHLAVLPDGRGACSIADGCGVLINSSGALVVNEASLLDETSGVVQSLPLSLVVNPYANEHAARVIEPARFEKGTFRRKQITPGISVIFAKRPGKDKLEIQAYRFDASRFTSTEAKKWLRDHMVRTRMFEAASGGVKKPKAGKKLSGPMMNEVSEDASPESIWQRIGVALGLVSNELSHSSLRRHLSEALRERFCEDMDRPGAVYRSCYVEEVYDEYVVFQWGEGLYSLGYSVNESDEVTLSEDEPSEVRLVTSYEEVANESPDQLPAGDVPPATNPGDNSMALTPAQKGEIVRTLLANCSCEKAPWKGLNEAALNGLSDDTLSAYNTFLPSLVPAAASVPISAPASASAPVGVFQTGQDAQGNRYILNTQTGKLEWVPPPPAAPAPVTPSSPATPVQNGIPVATPVKTGPKTMTEWASLLPASEQAKVNRYLQSEEQNHASLVERLVANTNCDPGMKDQLHNWLKDKPMNELELTAVIANLNQTEGVPVVNFTGAAGAVPQVGPAIVEMPLESPRYEWKKNGRQKMTS